MKVLVEEAMEAGAFGLSTGLTDVPSTHSDIQEIVEVAKVSSRYGGIYATHIRNEGTSWWSLSRRPSTSAGKPTCRCRSLTTRQWAG